MDELLYGNWEGIPVIFTAMEAWAYGDDHKWSEVHPADAVTKAAPMTHEEFDQMFGPLPRLPSAAFQAGDNRP